MPGHGKSRLNNTTIPLDALRERYGNADNLFKIYIDICKCLSGRCAEVCWKEYLNADWELFKKLVLGEGIAALINSKKPELKTLLEHIPIEIWLNFSTMRMRIKHTNDLRYKELIERVLPAILPELGPVVLLKGSALALTLYDDISLRNMSDFDILIKNKKTANEISLKLKNLEYRMSHDNDHLSKNHFYDKDLALEISSPFRFMIEFHWNPVDYHLSYGNNLTEWFFSQVIPLNDNPIFSEKAGLNVLSPTACFVLQILHCYLEHGLSSMSLSHVFETYYMIEKWGNLIKWEEVSRVFTDCGQFVFLKFVSEIINERFDIPLPIDRLYNSENSFTSFLIKSQAHKTKTHAALYLYNMESLPLNKKLKLFIESVFPNPSYMKERYKGHKNSLVTLYFKRWHNALTDIIMLLRNN